MKRNLLLLMAMAGGGASLLAASPYQGSAPAPGKYYLYQVESGKWLQPNMSNPDVWTTHAELGDVGMEIELKAPDQNILDMADPDRVFEGYQIYCNFTNNGELNGSDEDRFFLDQDARELTDWVFAPSGEGYTIMVKAKEGWDTDWNWNKDENGNPVNNRSTIAQDTYIGAYDGELSDEPTQKTWQLVTAEERFRVDTANASASNPVDVSWLIPWFDHGRNDMRDREWVTTQETDGGGMGLGGLNGYPVQEYWHQCLMDHHITLTGLPTGTYGFSVQAYYRDSEGLVEVESGEYNNEGNPIMKSVADPEWEQRIADGTEALDRVSYYAGASSANVMSIYQDGASAPGLGYSIEVAGKYLPNSMNEAGYAMLEGAYKNDYITAPVSDGNLTIGIKKTDRTHRDWLIYKRFYLSYNGSGLVAEDLSGLQAELSELIAEAKALPQTPSFEAAISEAESSLASAQSSTVLIQAIDDLTEATKVIKAAANDIKAYNETKAMGFSSESAEEMFNTAETAQDYAAAIKELRYARRLSVAERQADVYKGSEPAEGKFYLYNVGRGQFLQGGSDWGAHAALGMPGVELEFIAFTDESGAIADKNGYTAYIIKTGLANGQDENGNSNDYLSYRGYMDTPLGDNGGFVFIPVEGKEGVYNMVQGDYQDVHVAWNPYASVDAGHSDETTVGTEERNLDPTDANAQWKLVTRAEREALIEKASLENPVDVTFMMSNPGFNQRADLSAWSMGNYSIWGQGDNHYDFVAESWNTESCDLNQMVEGLPAGIYKVSAQGYYRNSSHSKAQENDGQSLGVANAEQVQNAFLYAGDETSDDVALPYILSESGKCPGEGDDAVSEDGSVTYNIPNSCDQAVNFFKSGLYKVSTVIDKPNANDLPIGVYKDVQGDAGDWVVVDNFRIVYYGADTTKDAVSGKEGDEGNNDPEEENPDAGVSGIEADTVAGKIYNLQGIEVENPTTPGIYIQDGKKFVVK